MNNSSLVNMIIWDVVHAEQKTASQAVVKATEAAVQVDAIG